MNMWARNDLAMDKVSWRNLCLLCNKCVKWWHNWEVVYVRPFIRPSVHPPVSLSTCIHPKPFDGFRLNLVLVVCTKTKTNLIFVCSDEFLLYIISTRNLSISEQVRKYTHSVIVLAIAFSLNYLKNCTSRGSLLGIEYIPPFLCNICLKRFSLR
jgi:hypothetical protein